MLLYPERQLSLETRSTVCEFSINPSFPLNERPHPYVSCHVFIAVKEQALKSAETARVRLYISLRGLTAEPWLNPNEYPLSNNT